MSTHDDVIEKAVFASASSYDPDTFSAYIVGAQRSAGEYLSLEYASASLEQLYGVTKASLEQIALHQTQAREKGASAVSINATAVHASPDELSYLPAPDVPNRRAQTNNIEDPGFAKT